MGNFDIGHVYRNSHSNLSYEDDIKCFVILQILIVN